MVCTMAYITIAQAHRVRRLLSYHSLVTGFFYPENLVRGLW